MDLKVAAVVFLYNYKIQNIDNIITYASQFDMVYAFDNTELKNKNYSVESFLKAIPNLVFIDGNGNQGLAVAINTAAKICIKNKYDWLVTFDQDSRGTENMVNKLKDFAKKNKDRTDIGIISPSIKKEELAYAEPLYEFSYVEWVFQSGAMHNLKAFKHVKGYNKKIFIDALDTEYCYRLLQNGYKIIRLNTSILLHNVNDEQVEFKYLNGKKYYINKFSPTRYYYVVRNNLYCKKKYGKQNVLFYAEANNMLNIIFKTWTLEDKKLKRGLAILLGTFDFLFDRMGKTRWKL